MTDKLRIWLISTNRLDEIYRYSKIFEKIEAEFEIGIELKIITWHTAYEDLLDAFEVGEEPDILEMGYTWISSFYDNDLLDSVPESATILTSIAPWLDNYAIKNNKRYGFPFFVEPYMLLANKANLTKYFGKLSVIKNFDHFQRICEKIEKNSRKKKLDIEIKAFTFEPKIELGTVLYFLSWLQKNGMSYPELNHKTSAFLDTKLFYETFKYLTEVISDYGIETDDALLLANTMRKKFIEEDEGVFILSNGEELISDTIRALKSKEAYNPKYLPFAIPNNSKNASLFSGGGFLCVSNFSQKKVLAWEVVAKLLTDEFVEQWCIDTGNVPAIEGNFWLKYGHDPLFKLIKQEAKQSINFPVHPTWRGIEYILMDGFLNMVQVYWVERKPLDEFYVKAAIETMNREIHQLIIKEIEE